MIQKKKLEEYKVNTKQMKPIRRKAKGILVEWLKTLLNKEEQAKVQKEYKKKQAQKKQALI